MGGRGGVCPCIGIKAYNIHTLYAHIQVSMHQLSVPGVAKRCGLATARSAGKSHTQWQTNQTRQRHMQFLWCAVSQTPYSVDYDQSHPHNTLDIHHDVCHGACPQGAYSTRICGALDTFMHRSQSFCSIRFLCWSPRTLLETGMNADSMTTHRRALSVNTATMAVAPPPKSGAGNAV